MEHYSSSYTILGIDLSLESDSKELIDIFERDYYLFNSRNSLHPVKEKQLQCSIFMMHSRLQHEDAPFIEINGKKFPFYGHPNPSNYIYQIILKELFNSIDDFIILHAGVVGKGDDALIIVGPPGAGKTTLALELITDGFIFLSDEFCPIHIKTKQVFPFPRTIWGASQNALHTEASFAHIHIPSMIARNPLQGPHTAESSESPPLRNPPGELRLHKSPICMDDLALPQLNKPYSPKWLLYLDTEWPEEEMQKIRMEIKNGYDEIVMTDLKKVSGISWQKVSQNPSAWILLYEKEYKTVSALKRLFKKHEQHIWDVFRIEPSGHDFNKTPMLEPLPAHDAVRYLLREMKQEIHFSPGQITAHLSPARLCMELYEFLKNVQCYRLSVGRIAEMKEKVAISIKHVFSDKL